MMALPTSPGAHSDTDTGIGRPVLRVEDARLLTGRGSFADNRDGSGHLHAVFVRSPHAHARITAVGLAKAQGAPGVVALYTAADLEADGVKPLPTAPILKQSDGSPMPAAPWHLLALDTARHVGDPLVMVIAGTREQAQDAAEAVEIAFEALEAVSDAREAVEPRAPQVWENIAGNVAATYECGDRAKVEAAFASARHVAHVAIMNQRLAGNPLEARAAICEIDGGSGVRTLHCTSQYSHLVRNLLADAVLRVPRDKLRVTVSDMGGGFGTKAAVYPEYALVAWAAGKLQRTVRWTASRSESFLSDVQGRDLHTEAWLALDSHGRFTALKVRSLANLGACQTWLGPAIPTLAATRVIANAYRTPAIHVEVRLVMTHTTPVEAYRGAGRPEYVFMMERLVEQAARATGIDSIELRRRNFIAKSDMPFTTSLGDIYDSGDFLRVMEAARHAADWNGFAARRSEAEQRGQLLGRGIAYYVESTGAANPSERVELVVHADGRVTLLSGTQAMGQGLETTYSQIVAGRLGLRLDQIELVQGDTARIISGGGSGGSRSLFIGGSAALAGSDALIAAARVLAGQSLEVAPEDLAYDNARFRVAGTDRSIGLFELAASQPQQRISVSHKTTVKGMSWPNGCHVCEIEVDPETGASRISRFVAVDDVGTVVNPAIVHGQVHGGIAQGAGQAVMEHCIYDAASGQPLTGSFMDYAMPRADDFPMFDVFTDESSPCRTNALGAKGAGEGGAIGAPPAVVNAMVDALGLQGDVAANMPFDSQKVWRLLHRRRESSPLMEAVA
jgi:carbon-monoxide dehydrogenase large subunit